MEFSKVIDIEDFASEALRPYLTEIANDEKELFGISSSVVVPDSKNWETAIALHSFEQQGLLKEGNLFAGIGAGTERMTQMLSNRGTIVFPVDIS